MNILPKKRWHVRTKDNIARVRRDEALAAEQAKAKEEKIFIADQEAKINYLRLKARERFGSGTKEENSNSKSTTNTEDRNLLKNIEESDLDYKKNNEDYLKDKKEEKEKYEKQIGYLTYLGQDTDEALGKKNWYDVAPNRDKSDIEVNATKKLLDDPLYVMKSYLGKKTGSSAENKLNKSECSTANENKYGKYGKHRNRKHENTSSDEEDVEPKNKKMKHNKTTVKGNSKLDIKNNKKSNIEMLRAERLKREKEEKARANALLYQIKNPEKNKIEEKSSFKQKFSSQYNPDVAKQNYT